MLYPTEISVKIILAVPLVCVNEPRGVKKKNGYESRKRVNEEAGLQGEDIQTWKPVPTKNRLCSGTVISYECNSFSGHRILSAKLRNTLFIFW